MTASKVYFSDMRIKPGDSLPAKMIRLVKAAGIEKIDFKNKYVAIKLHFGEPGNLAYLRPQYSAALVKLIQSLGGKPFLTDCNTLYVGGRKNALDHLDTAFQNGFSPLSSGAHVIIADGLKGTDEALVPVNGEYVKEAKIGRALMDADIIISLSHFKGHECAGMGGAIKNIGMGGGSRAGKMEMHSAGKPVVNQELCVGCGKCVSICAHDAPRIVDRKASIDHNKCAGCGRCIGNCAVDAIAAELDEAFDIMNKKMAEYTKAIVQGRPNFHISIATDISPFCDCYGGNDTPIVPNVGMFASFDPVAIDVAAADQVNKQPVLQGSLLAEVEHKHSDYFTDITPTTNWRVSVEHAEKIGIGTREYELVKI